MTAAAVTPTYILEEPVRVDGFSGTPVRLRKFIIKGTKAAQNDWFAAQTLLGYTDITGKIVSLTGITLDGSNDNAAETLTYDDSADKIVLGSATTGTAIVTVVVQAE